MLKDKFINIDGVVVNTDIVQSVVPDGEGGVRIYINMLNDGDPNRPAFWAYEGDVAAKLIAFFQGNATTI